MNITFEKAVTILWKLEEKIAAVGYHTALTGSVLYKGGSDDDCDVILYPHNPKVKLTDEALEAALVDADFKIIQRTTPQYVNRQVWICHHASTGWRFDFFVSDTSHKQAA